MKQFFFAILFLGTGFLVAQEQEESALYPVSGDMEFGIHTAFNTTFLSENGFSEADGYADAYGATFGLQVDYYFSKTWSVRGRLNYDYKVVATEGQAVEDDLHFITLPIMAAWHFGKKKRWYLHFGLYYGLMVGQSDRVEAIYNSFDVGSDIGVGVRIPVKNEKWFFIETDGQNSYKNPFKGNTGQELSLVRTTLGVGLIF